MALWCAPHAASAEPTLRVRAQVAIDLQAVKRGATLRVEGTLRDDLGARLKHRQLTAVFDGASTPQAARVRNITTDERGEFSLGAPCEGCSVLLEFPGDTYYEQAVASLKVEVAVPALSLDIVEPTELAVSLDQPQFGVVVRASGPAPVDGIQVWVENELVRELGRGLTGPDGVLLLQLPSDRLGPYGLGEIVARVAASPEHTAARASKAVLRTRSTQTALRADFDAKHRQLRVLLSLRTQQGPVAQRAVGVLLDNTLWTTLVTDEQGQASSLIDLAQTTLPAGRHALSADFQADIPGLLSSTSPVVSLEIAPPLRPNGAWLLLPALASLAFVIYSARRSPSQTKHAETAPPAGPDVRMGEVRGRTVPQHVVSGRVEDVDSDLPIAAALELFSKQELRAVVPTAADGRFESEALPPGDYRARVVAPGYATVEFTLCVPHYGTASDMHIAARSLRAIALDTYSQFATRVMPEARTGGKTVRETVSAAVGCGKATPSITALAEAAETLAYAQPVPFEDDLRDLQRAAACALRELGHPGTEQPDPDLGW